MCWRPSIQRRRNRICWELSKVCSQIVLKFLHLTRNSRPDIYGPWTRLFVPSQSGSERTFDAHQCRMGLLQDSDFAGDLEDKVDIRWNLMHFSEAERKPTDARHPKSRSWEIGYRSVSLLTKPTQWIRRFFWTGKPVAQHLIKQAHETSSRSSNQARQPWFVQCWQCAFEFDIF